MINVYEEDLLFGEGREKAQVNVKGFNSIRENPDKNEWPAAVDRESREFN